MNEIILTEKEYEFLQHFLVKNNFPIEILKAGVPPRLVLNARYTHNQMINYPQIMNQHPSVVFHGGKAEMMMSTTGYSVGTQVTNYNFIIFHYYF